MIVDAWSDIRQRRHNDDLMTSNTIGALRWNAMGSPGFLDIVDGTLRDFGVSIYTVMDGGPSGGQRCLGGRSERGAAFPALHVVAVASNQRR